MPLRKSEALQELLHESRDAGIRVSETSYRITFSRSEVRVKLSDEDKAYLERVENPYDLEDGLLAVEYDEIKARIARELNGRYEQRILKLLGGAA